MRAKEWRVTHCFSSLHSPETHAFVVAVTLIPIFPLMRDAGVDPDFDISAGVDADLKVDEKFGDIGFEFNLIKRHLFSASADRKESLETISVVLKANPLRPCDSVASRPFTLMNTEFEDSVGVTQSYFQHNCNHFDDIDRWIHDIEVEQSSLLSQKTSILWLDNQTKQVFSEAPCTVGVAVAALEKVPSSRQPNICEPITAVVNDSSVALCCGQTAKSCQG
jgi:hypothetical protein